MLQENNYETLYGAFTEDVPINEDELELMEGWDENE